MNKSAENFKKHLLPLGIISIGVFISICVLISFNRPRGVPILPLFIIYPILVLVSLMIDNALIKKSMNSQTKRFLLNYVILNLIFILFCLFGGSAEAIMWLPIAVLISLPPLLIPVIVGVITANRMFNSEN